jgi:hypothetical protein
VVVKQEGFGRSPVVVSPGINHPRVEHVQRTEAQSAAEEIAGFAWIRSSTSKFGSPPWLHRRRHASIATGDHGARAWRSLFEAAWGAERVSRALKATTVPAGGVCGGRTRCDHPPRTSLELSSAALRSEHTGGPRVIVYRKNMRAGGRFGLS